MTARKQSLRAWLLGASLVQVIFVLGAVFVTLSTNAPGIETVALAQAETILAHLPHAADERARYLQERADILGYELTLESEAGSARFTPAHAPAPSAPPMPAVTRGEERLVVRPMGLEPPSPAPLLAGMLVILLLVVGFAVLVARRILAPLRTLATAVESFTRGDLSARASVERQDELGQLAAQYDRMAQEIASLVRAKDDLLGAVAHELRTPLARLHVTLDLLAEGHLSERVNVARTLKELREVETIVDDVLLLARATGGRELPTRALDVSALLREVVGHHRESSDQPVVLDEPDRPVHVQAAESLLRRVLGNIIHNALVHGRSPAGARVTLEDAGERICIRVEDQGQGMTETARERALEPFYRGDAARLRETGGVGLGLTLAARFLRAMKGDIHLDSTQGKGTRVRMWLPRAAE